MQTQLIEFAPRLVPQYFKSVSGGRSAGFTDLNPLIPLINLDRAIRNSSLDNRPHRPPRYSFQARRNATPTEIIATTSNPANRTVIMSSDNRLEPSALIPAASMASMASTP